MRAVLYKEVSYLPRVQYSLLVNQHNNRRRHHHHTYFFVYFVIELSTKKKSCVSRRRSADHLAKLFMDMFFLYICRLCGAFRWFWWAAEFNAMTRPSPKCEEKEIKSCFPLFRIVESFNELVCNYSTLKDQISAEKIEVKTLKTIEFMTFYYARCWAFFGACIECANYHNSFVA